MAIPKVRNLTRKAPANGLPKWVKDAAARRGYGDATKPLSLFVTQDDIANAFDCVGRGDGAKCVMAQAGQRLGAKKIYFYRTTVWADFGTGPIQRFETTKTIYRNIIAPFDKGNRRGIIPGMYTLTPPCKSHQLGPRRKHAKTNQKRDHRAKHKMVFHTERLVMAAQQER